jgi:drug/metabolite transporter (DMT)-like permease
MSSFPKDWYNAFIWLMYTSLGLLLPVLGALLLVGAVSDITLGDFTDGGQFAIYTSAMLAGTLYLVAKPAQLRLGFTEGLGWLVCTGLFVAGVLFALATLSSSVEDIDRDFFRWPSIGLSIVSVGVAFSAVVLDQRRMETDLPERMSLEEEDLRKKFRQTESS